MARKKVEDYQILNAIDELSAEQQERWKKRFGDLDGWPDMFQRSSIQKKVKELFDIEMSKSGFRSRLKNLVEEGELEKIRLFPRVTFYQK